MSVWINLAAGLAFSFLRLLEPLVYKIAVFDSLPKAVRYGSPPRQKPPPNPHHPIFEAPTTL